MSRVASDEAQRARRGGRRAAGRQIPEPSRWGSLGTGAVLLLVIGTYGLVGPSHGLAGALAVAAAVGALLPRRAALGMVAQLLLAGVLFTMGIAVITSAFVVPEPVAMGTLRLGWSAAAFATLLVAISRLFVAEPLGGHPTTLAIALFALAFCGGTVSGVTYPLAVGVFLAAAALARRLADPGRAPVNTRLGRSAAVIAFSVATAGAATHAATLVLPRLHGWMVRQIMHAAQPRTGFSTTMWLGSMRGMLLSDRVVLRLRGKRADYLRGMVFTRYERGRWVAADEGRFVTTDLPRAVVGADGGQGTLVEVVEEEPDRYFLPLRVRRLAVETGMAGVHPMGMVRPVAAYETDRYAFEAGSPPEIFVQGPDEVDRRVPPELRLELEKVAARFTRGAGPDPFAQLTAIERALSGQYRYALRFKRGGRHDPIIDFLQRNPQGHCEYFASAMVLLARAHHIPARLVGGYRVTEYSQLGDYYLVRDRNAHAWVEAWVPGRGWTTFDPTPAADLALAMRSSTPWPSAVVDLLRSWWAVVLRWLDRRTVWELLAALLALAAIGLGVRIHRALRERSSAKDSSQDEVPLELFTTVTAALAQCGILRAHHEPIERLATRAEESSLPPRLGEAAASVLRRYAALRYGGVGDERPLAAEAGRLVRRLRRAGATRARRGG